MRRSLGELRHNCQKAGEGAGVPAGLDIAAAEAVVWLAARGLDPLETFLAALAGVSEGTARCDLRPNASGSLDAGGTAGVFIAPALIDLLAVRGRLSVTALSAPLFLLPPASRHAEAGRSFRIDLSGPDGRRYRLTASPEDGPSIFGPAAAADDGPFTLEAVCGPAPASGPDDLPRVAEAATLAGRAAESLAVGLPIAPETWDRLQVHAKKVLVPATAESRGSGAGWSGSRGG